MVDVCGIFALVLLACDLERFFAITLFGAVVESGFCIMVNHCRHLPCCESRQASWKIWGWRPTRAFTVLILTASLKQEKLIKLKLILARAYIARATFSEGTKAGFISSRHSRVSHHE